MEKHLLKSFQNESSRTKRRRIRKNVEKAVLAISAFANVPDSAPTDTVACVADVCENPCTSASCIEFDNSEDNDVVDVASHIESNKQCDVSSGYCGTDNSFCFDDHTDSSSAFDTDSEINDTDLADELAGWVHRCDVLLSHVGLLLGILRKYHPSLPKDPRTLVKTERKVFIKQLKEGHYHHFGIKPTLTNLWNRNCLTVSDNSKQLLLQVNVDGLQVFKSSSYQFWPILGTIMNSVERKVFEIGIYGGYKKPVSVDEFLCEFVKELLQLCENDEVALGHISYSVAIHSVVCDAPARAFIKVIKAHNSYYGCERCVDVGKWTSHRVAFLSTDKPLRTDESFARETDEDHHIGKSLLACLPIGMVTHFPLDSMHLVYLGVVRRLILFWLRGPLNRNCRLSGHSVHIVSDRMLQMRNVMCKEFARKPRSLADVDRWKATEFRAFLLYLGPVVMMDVLSKEHYEHFLLLHVSLYCLNCKRLNQTHVEYAKKLLVCFVQDAVELYGEEFVVYNVHSLIHICDDVMKYKQINAITAFPFENHMKQLRKAVRQARDPLEQAVKRIYERRNTNTGIDVCDAWVSDDSGGAKCQSEHSAGPVLEQHSHVKQFAKVTFGKCTLTLQPSDDCVKLANGDIGIVRNILKTDSGVLLLYARFSVVGSLFTSPYKSELSGFCYKVSNMDGCLQSCNLDAVVAKCLRLPYSRDINVYVVIPMCHNEVY